MLYTDVQGMWGNLVNNLVNYFSFELGFSDVYIDHSLLDPRKFQLNWHKIASFIAIFRNAFTRPILPLWLISFMALKDSDYIPWLDIISSTTYSICDVPWQIPHAWTRVCSYFPTALQWLIYCNGYGGTEVTPYGAPEVTSRTLCYITG